jgi:hypothetical protein
MEKWSVGIQRDMVWTHYREAPLFDTEDEATAWRYDWLTKQPEAIQAGLASQLTVRRLINTKPL